MEVLNKSSEAIKEALRAAASRSSNKEAKSRYPSLHREQVFRASYFTEIAKVIRDFGLSNAFEKTALSLEPPHPVPPSRINSELSKLPGLRGQGLDAAETKLSLLSLRMLSAYSPHSDAVAAAWHNSAPLYALDPQYGFGFFLRQDGTFGNHCFAIDFWQSRLRSMPLDLQTFMWTKRANNMLSAGVLSARHVFNGLLPPARSDWERSIAPEILVRSQSHLEEIVSELTEASKKVPNLELWFRGQSIDFQTPNRDGLLKLGLTPYSNVPESDFTPSLYRRYDEHLETITSYDELLLELSEWVDAAQALLPETNHLHSDFSKRNRHALPDVGLTTFQHGLLLQQYGAPSAYLDITSAHLTAAWFATNKCAQKKDGEWIFSSHKWTGENPAEWPTIFVFPLVEGVHPFLRLSSILPPDLALRPQRQSCGLLGGAGNLARNYCARFLGLKLRLSPEFALKDPDQKRFLVPSASEDPVLAALQNGGFSSEGRRYPATYVAH